MLLLRYNPTMLDTIGGSAHNRGLLPPLSPDREWDELSLSPWLPHEGAFPRRQAEKVGRWVRVSWVGTWGSSTQLSD